MNSAIAACASNSIILLTNNGTSRFSYAAEMVIAKDGVFVVGETNSTGQPSVVIDSASTTSDRVVYISKGQGSSGDIFSGITAYTVWTNTYSMTRKGSTRVATTATPVGIAVGDLITIDQLEGDAAGLVESDGNSGTGAWLGRESGNRSFAQTLLVTNVVNGTNIDFEPPLFSDFNIEQSIQVAEQPSILRNAGLANVIITNTGSARDTIAMHGAHRSGLINCKLYISDRRHVWEFGGSQTFYVGCDFRFGDGADWSAAYTSDSAYGLFLGQNGGFTFVNGCFIEKLSYGIALEGARQGDVVVYTLITNIQNDSLIAGKPSTGNHGSHPNMIYLAFNWFDARLSMDHYWGSSSYWLFLRNRFRIISPQNGTPITQYWVVADFWTNNVYHTMLGNMLGTAGVENKLHVASGDSVNEGSSVKAIWRLGNLDANHTTWSQYDPTVSNTLHRSVNYLSRTNTGVAGAGIEYGDGITDTNVPVSLHDFSKPTEQGFLPWIGNDVFADPATWSETNIWGGYRARYGTNPPAAQGGEPGPDPSITARIAPGARNPNRL